MSPAKPRRRAALLAALLCLAAIAPAAAQAPQALYNPARLERNAVELKAGMTLEEVQKLLGKPKRTALKAAGGFAGESANGTLQWTYAWSAEQSLHIVFAARTAGEWLVTSWDWSGY